jgi:hypothetical protein
MGPGLFSFAGQQLDVNWDFLRIFRPFGKPVALGALSETGRTFVMERGAITLRHVHF